MIFRVGWFAVRWYSLAYITGILAGWWYVIKLIDRPGAPMARRHVDDFVFWATIAVIAGENAESAGINGERFMQSKLGGEVRNGLRTQVERAGGRLHVRVERGNDRLISRYKA